MKTDSGNRGLVLTIRSIRKYFVVLALAVMQGFVGAAIGANECEDIREVQTRAKSGDAAAQRTLGYWARNGTCVQKNRTEAIRWFESAFSDAYPDVGEELAEIYLDSERPSDADVKRALEILNDNVRNEYAPSQTMLGTLFAEGIVVKQDFKKAYDLWSKAEKTDRTAKYNLASLYDRGDGVKRDPVKALSLAKESAEAGALSAFRGLCGAYVRGDSFGVTSDLRAAYPYCFKAASLKDLPSMNLLAHIYLKTGKAGDALLWLRRSAENGNADAQYSLGMILIRGLADVRPDPKEGRSHLLRAAAQSHKKAKEAVSTLGIDR